MMSLSSLSLPALSLVLALTAACSRSDTVSTRSDAARTNGVSDIDVTSSAPTGPGGVNNAANGSGPTRFDAAANGAGPVRIDPSQVPNAAPAAGLGDTTYVDSMVGGGAVRPMPGVAGAPPGAGVGNGPGFNARNDGTPIAGVAPTVTPTAPVVGTSQFPASQLPAPANGQPATNGPINPGYGPGVNQGARNQADGPGTIPPGGTPDNRPGMDPGNPASPVAPPAGVVPMR